MFIPPANSLSAEIHFEHLYTAVGYRNLTQKGYKWPPHPPPQPPQVEMVSPEFSTATHTKPSFRGAE